MAALADRSVTITRRPFADCARGGDGRDFSDGACEGETAWDCWLGCLEDDEDDREAAAVTLLPGREVFLTVASIGEEAEVRNPDGEGVSATASRRALRRSI